jgi:UDP-N-acetylglucosamine 2-epimerase (non-hydrolysing)
MLSVVETRAGQIKAKAVVDAIQEFNRATPDSPIEHVLVHTGQLADTRGFDLRFNDLELPRPELFLEIGSTRDPVERTAGIAERFANVLLRERPTLVLLTGEFDSVLDCALVTKKTRFYCAGQSFAPALAHIEAGRRNFDRGSLQEVNRIVVDMLADYLFTSEESATENLLREGVAGEKIHFVGSIVVETLLRHRARLADSSILTDLQLTDGSSIKPFALLALEELSREDGIGRLSQFQMAFGEIARRMPVIFPATGAVTKLIHQAGLGDQFVDHCLDAAAPGDERVRIRLAPPLGYFDFARLAGAAKIVLTDTPSIEEESRVLGVPCIILPGDGSKPMTAEAGANRLNGVDPERVCQAFAKAAEGALVHRELPRGWDGQATRRIINILSDAFASGASSRRIPKENGIAPEWVAGL